MTVDEVRGTVGHWAAAEPLIRRVYLFGSQAKGTARPDSDFDLAILYTIDPTVKGTCDRRMEHYFTWQDHSQRWRGALQERLGGRADVWPIDRDGRKVVVPALKQCRVCLYRRDQPVCE